MSSGHRVCAAWPPALPLNAPSTCGSPSPHPTLILRVYTARMVCPPYLLPPRSRVRIVCGFTLYACPAHMCCTLPMAIPTYNQRPPPAATTGPCESCVTMPAWACNGECRDMRCTSSSSSTHMPDALPIHTPTHMVSPCAHFPLPTRYICRQRGARTMGRLPRVQAG